MPTLRKVFGPFHPETKKTNSGMRLLWHFFGIRDTYEIAMWVLAFDPLTREFSAHAVPIPRSGSPITEPHLFLRPDEPVLTGRIVDILRQRLPREELARAIALSITGT